MDIDINTHITIRNNIKISAITTSYPRLIEAWSNEEKYPLWLHGNLGAWSSNSPALTLCSNEIAKIAPPDPNTPAAPMS